MKYKVVSIQLICSVFTTKEKTLSTFLPFSLYDAGRRATAVEDLNGCLVLESRRMKLLDPRNAALA